jgi:DUF971 family protein
MTLQNLFPTAIEPKDSESFTITWADGVLSTLKYREVRYQCPCAHCVDEHTGRRTLKREQVASDVRAVGVEVVGRYAVQFRWSDGHQTGIYPFEALRAIG